MVYEIEAMPLWADGTAFSFGSYRRFHRGEVLSGLLFAFAVDFEYFFIKSDEMPEEYMNKSASRAFYCGMITVALVCVVCFFAGLKQEKEALITGLASGWAVSVTVYALSTAYYGFKEKWGLENDQE